MLKWFQLFVVLVILLSHSALADLSQFTCQIGPKNCPDKGSQLMSNGGNVTIKVIRAKNLKNSNPGMGGVGVANPFVSFIINDKKSNSRVATNNNINPVWNDHVNIGLLASGTEVKVKVYEHNSGAGFLNVPVASGIFKVPFCTTFNSTEQDVDCGKPFGCEAKDSKWGMPSRKMCTEIGSIPIGKHQRCDHPATANVAACLYVEINIVPAQVEVPVVNEDIMTGAPLLSAVGNTASNPEGQHTHTYEFGKPFVDSATKLLLRNEKAGQFPPWLYGSLMLRTRDSDKYRGEPGEVAFYAVVNFPAYVYVCRPMVDNEIGIPKWLTNRWRADNITTKFSLDPEDFGGDFGCFFIEHSGTVRNKYGGVIGDPIEFRSNTIDGLTSPTQYAHNYFVIIQPRIIVPPDTTVEIIYDAALFMDSVGAFGLIFMWFMFIIARFLKKIDYRLQNIKPFLVSRLMTGPEKSLVSTLFMSYGQTPCNIEFRSRLFHATNAVYMLMMIPPWLLIAWGTVVSNEMQPPALGYAVMFLGNAALFLWYGFRLWEESKWRMSPVALASHGISMFLVLLFIICVIFVDPAVELYNYPLNFSALGLLFGTINVMPLLFLVFKQDKTYKVQLKKLINLMSDAAYQSKGKEVDSNAKGGSGLPTLSANKALHILLGEGYNVSSKLPMFKYASVIAEPVKDDLVTPVELPAGVVSLEPPNSTKEQEMESQSSAEMHAGEELYMSSLFVLFLYLIIAAARTDQPSVAFLNCLTLILFDTIHTNLSHGDTNWSPSFKIAVLVAGRLLVMASGGNTWLQCYSCAYLVYAGCLSNEVVSKMLPVLSVRQAGEAAFSGKEDVHKEIHDISASPQFCLMMLTFAFVGLLLISNYGDTASANLAHPEVEVMGAFWPSHTFGVLAIIVCLTGTLITATARAFYLQAHGLLRGWARTSYMMSRDVNVPLILATFAEIALLTSGLLFYGITRSSCVMTFAVFLPPIIMCFGNAYRIWKKNDHELVFWPPRDSADLLDNDSPSDLEVAFHMIDNIFAEEDNDEVPETDAAEDRALKGFKLPKLEATGKKIDGPIKMPPLPLKSVLRRKREAMGIKVKTPLVKDLAMREGGDADKFGNAAAGLLDDDDPWAALEAEEEEEVNTRPKTVPKKAARIVKERGGFMNHPFVLDTKEAFEESAIGKFLILWYGKLKEYLAKRKAAYAKIDPNAGADVEGGSRPGTAEGEEEVGEDGETRLVALKGEGEEGGELDEDGKPLEDKMPESENLSIMPFYSAVFGGYLTDAEYNALFSWYGGLFLVFLMGVVLGRTVEPYYFGHVLWMIFFVFVFALVPVYKYFHTFEIDRTMKEMGVFALFFHLLFFLVWFSIFLLDTDVTIRGGIWVLLYFIYFPMILYLFVEMVKWRDNNYVLEPLDKDGDGDVSTKEYMEFFKFYPLFGVMMTILIGLVFAWVSSIVGTVMVLMLLVSLFGFPFVWDWATNDFFISPELSNIGEWLIRVTMFLTLMIAMFEPANPLFALSVFFFVFIIRCCLKVFAKVMIADSETLLFFSPYVMPIYSYDPKNNDVVDETPVAKQILYALIAALLWGCAMSVFLYPVNVGVGVACLFLLIVTSVVVAAVSFVPLQLGKYASMLGTDVIREAAASAHEKFEERKLPLELAMPDFDKKKEAANVRAHEDEDDWDGENKKKRATATKKKEELEAKVAPVFKSQFDKDIAKSSVTLGMELVDNTRALTHVRDDGPGTVVDIMDEKEKVYGFFMKLVIMAYDTAGKFFQAMTTKKGWQVHSESQFHFSDMVAEAILTGKGSFGFMGAEGMWFKLFKYAKEQPKLQFLRQPWLNRFDEYGNDRSYVLLSEKMDTIPIFSRLTQLEKAVDFVYREEQRCSVHFLLMLMVAADAKMQREQVLFQKFLRENRFRLASNGITPPSKIFLSTSFASIDIQLVAVWLSTLSVEERERFHLLKKNFSEEQAVRDEAVDNEDYQMNYDAYGLAKDRELRELEMADHVQRDIQRLQSEKIAAFADSLHPVEKTKFMIKKELWMSNADCFVASMDRDLHDKFLTQCMQDKDEATSYARAAIAELEAAERDCRIGEYGRSYQYVDNDFMPGDTIIGDPDLSARIMGWRCSPGIADHSQLFDMNGGTDPDDVQAGIFNDEWLLSAISMLAAAGGVDDGKVDPQILNLFINHYTADGELTFATDVGAYCVRIYKRGVWCPLVMDDIFPLLKNANWTTENRGMACAYTKECGSLWVSMIEKAFAKYYGNYAMLSKGYVHHALEDLTGCEASCLSLAGASRGIGKRALWDNLIGFKKNGYILGAGTGSSQLADKELQDMGIVFSAAYTVYDVLYIDGHQLIKLRNPPGDHEVWKGDWGSGRSRLWNRRLKAKLQYNAEDKNSFWITFDDFCNVFRYVYVCRWNDSTRWSTVQYPGMWKLPSVKELEMALSMKQEMTGGEELEESKAAKRKAMREEAIAHLDTAGGLPTKHNPACVLENNPHFSLLINRPTETRITVSQTDSRGQGGATVLPFAIFVVRNEHPTTPMRLTKLDKENVVFSTGYPRPERTQHLYAKLMPGLYVVFVAAYLQGMEGNFTIKLLSNCRNDFQPLWPAKWMLGGSAEIQQSGAEEKMSEVAGFIQTGLKFLVGDDGDSDDDKDSDEEDEEK